MLARSIVCWLLVAAALYCTCSAMRGHTTKTRPSTTQPTAITRPSTTQPPTTAQASTTPTTPIRELSTSSSTTVEPNDEATVATTIIHTTDVSTSSSRSTVQTTEALSTATPTASHSTIPSSTITDSEETYTPTMDIHSEFKFADHNSMYENTNTAYTTEQNGLSLETKAGIAVSAVLFGLLLFTIGTILTIAIWMTAGSRRKLHTPRGQNNIHALDNPTYGEEYAKTESVEDGTKTPQTNDTQHIYHVLEGPTPGKQQPTAQHVYESVCEMDGGSNVPQPQLTAPSRLSICSERVVPAPQQQGPKRHDYEPVTNFRNSKANYDHLEPQEGSEGPTDQDNTHTHGNRDSTFKPNYDSLERKMEKRVSLVIVGDYASLEGPTHNYAVLHPHISNAKYLEAKRLSQVPTPDGEYSHLIHC